MVITPKEAIELTHLEKDIVLDLERRIDAQIKEEFVCGKTEYIEYKFVVPKGYTKKPQVLDRIKNEIIRRYNEAGWKAWLQFRGSENYFIFEPKGKYESCEEE